MGAEGGKLSGAIQLQGHRLFLFLQPIHGLSLVTTGWVTGPLWLFQPSCRGSIRKRRQGTLGRSSPCLPKLFFKTAVMGQVASRCLSRPLHLDSSTSRCPVGSVHVGCASKQWLPLFFTIFMFWGVTEFHSRFLK